MSFPRFGRIATLLLFAAALPILAHPAAVSADGITVGGGAVVATDRLNLRAGPGSDNPSVASLPEGTALRVLAGPVEDSWWRVTDGASAGYVDGSWLQPGDPPQDSAAFDLDLALPFHRQMTAVWCDPADLQSWAEYVQGQSIGDDYAVQQQTWNWELSHNAGYTVDQWNASPYAVASAANRLLPDRGYNHFTYDDGYAATRTIAWQLANPRYGEPAVALIWRGEHYILVRGVRATADPYADYANARILGVYVMDPNKGARSWLGEDRYIPIDEWIGMHLTAATYTTPHTGVPGDVWQDKIVTIQRDWTADGPTLEGRSNASPRSYEAGAQ